MKKAPPLAGKRNQATESLQRNPVFNGRQPTTEGPEISEDKSLLEIRNLSVAYNSALVLRDVSLKLLAGNLVGIIGPNGAGKSTLLKSILGMLRFNGQVLIEGKPVNQVRQRLAYVPQKEEVRWDFPVTAHDVVMMGRYRRIGWLRGPAKEDHRVVNEALEKVEMISYKDRQISQLSGGQQQRVFMARALAQEGDIILLDEPLTGVDATSQEVILKLLNLLKDQKKLILMATHDLNTAFQECSLVVCLNRHLVAAGKPSEVFNSTVFAATFGGKVLTFDGLPSFFLDQH